MKKVLGFILAIALCQLLFACASEPEQEPFPSAAAETFPPMYAVILPSEAPGYQKKPESLRIPDYGADEVIGYFNEVALDVENMDAKAAAEVIRELYQ